MPPKKRPRLSKRANKAAGDPEPAEPTDEISGENSGQNSDPEHSVARSSVTGDTSGPRSMASCSLAAPSTSPAACESRRPAPLEQLLAEAREAGSFGPTQPASHGRLQASCDLEEAHRRRMEAQARRREDARLREQWAAEMLTYVNSHQLGWQQFLLLEFASLPASANKTWGVLRHEFLTAYHASRGDPDSAAKPSVENQTATLHKIFVLLCVRCHTHADALSLVSRVLSAVTTVVCAISAVICWASFK